MTKLTIALALVLCTQMFAPMFAPMFASLALAKGATTQNHHCTKDGQALPDKTHKQCTKEGGKWEKDAAAPKAAAGGAKETTAEKKAELGEDKRSEPTAEPPPEKKAEPTAK
jgi:hypothetical protein